MEKEKNLQHTQIPNGMGKSHLDPKDQYIYVIIKSYQNEKTKKCFPSLQEIASKSGASIPTVRESIKRLIDSKYMSVEKIGRKNYYSFSEYKKFEPISPDFISKSDISFTTKAYLVASQQYMYKDIENVGKLSFSNRELSNQINMPEVTIRKCNNELASKDYLTILKNESRDIQTGCKTDTKLYDLNKLGQAVVWALCNHEERIQKNTEDIDNLYKQLAEQQKLIESLLKERELEKRAKEVEQLV